MEIVKTLNYKIKNLKIRLKEKLGNKIYSQLIRAGKSFITHPSYSIKRKALKVMLGVTWKCQCKCVYCWSWDEHINEKEELSTDEIRKIINQTSAIPSLFTVISFCGGEPLLREDLVDLVSYARKHGLFTEIESNGILLNRRNVIRLKKAGLHHVFVSLQSANSLLHNRLNNYPDCFQKAIEGIKNCKEEKLAVSISTIAFRENIYSRELENIIKLGALLKVASIRILYPMPVGRWKERSDIILNAEEKKYVKSLLRPDFVYLESSHVAAQEVQRFCPAAQGKFMYISPYGEIQPCPFVNLNFGNIRFKNLNTVLEDMAKNFYPANFSRFCIYP